MTFAKNRDMYEPNEMVLTTVSLDVRASSIQEVVKVVDNIEDHDPSKTILLRRKYVFRFGKTVNILKGGFSESHLFSSNPLPLVLKTRFQIEAWQSNDGLAAVCEQLERVQVQPKAKLKKKRTRKVHKTTVLMTKVDALMNALKQLEVWLLCEGDGDGRTDFLSFP